MSTVTRATTADLQAGLVAEGFAFVGAGAMREFLASFGSLADWPAFAESWNHLELDAYMADGGRYRRRRHAVFSAAPGCSVVREAHQAHFQTLDYNPLHGGVARWFEPMDPAIGSGATMTTVLAFCRALFDTLAPTVGRWRIEVHQFRIEARPNEVGRPTPEGLHRDGVDYVLVLLVERRNIASGVTAIHATDGTPLGQFTLTNPCDAALVDDRRVAHGVTPVRPFDPARPAYRDVLVVTFRKA
jgi:hypothetical protein